MKFYEPHQRRERPEPLPGMRVLYRDARAAVADKDVGLLCAPGRDIEEASLLDLLENELGGQALAVHQLDREASGVVIAARDSAAQALLIRQFEERAAGLLYLALVHGVPPNAFSIDLPEPHNGGRAVGTGLEPAGEPALLQIVVLERFARLALLACRPQPGSAQRLRAALAERGFPLVADSEHDRRGPLLLSQIKRGYRHKPDEIERPLIARPALHAARLEIALPGETAPREFEAPLPADVELALKMLRKYARS